MAFSDTLWSTLKRGKLCCFYYLFYWVDREIGEGGFRLNCNLKFWMVKREIMNEIGPTGIEVGRIVSYLLSISSTGPQRGGRSNSYLKFWIVKRENMKENGPVGIKVGRIFGPNSVYSCLGPLWNFDLILAVYDMVQWCVIIINWKGLKVLNLRSPLIIWTKLGLWLPRTLFGRTSTGENCVLSTLLSWGEGDRSNFYCE